MIESTFAARGVVEGHASGLRDLPSINAFAAAGLASDHEVQTPEETWDKLTRGLFVELRVYAMAEIVAWLLVKGLQDWSQIAFTTDDRSASHTLELGASDHNARVAIEAGLPPEVAIQCLTINPARHMRLTPYVGSLSPGRFGDVVCCPMSASSPFPKYGPMAPKCRTVRITWARFRRFNGPT